MPRELPLEIQPPPTERKIDPFGCVGLVAIYAVLMGLLLTFEVGGRESESIPAIRILSYIAIDFLAVTAFLWQYREPNLLYSKFSLKLDEEGLTVKTPRARRPRLVRWETMRSFSIELVNAKGRVGRWPTIWGEGEVILTQWTNTWHSHAPREAEIEEYIHHRLTGGDSQSIEHNRLAHLWAASHPDWLTSTEDGNRHVVQIRKWLAGAGLAILSVAPLYGVLAYTDHKMNVVTLPVMLYSVGSGLILLINGRTTLRVSADAIDLILPLERYHLNWNEVKSIELDLEGKKIVFNGANQKLVFVGPTSWGAKENSNAFHWIVMLSEKHRIPFKYYLAKDLPNYLHLKFGVALRKKISQTLKSPPKA